MKRRKIAMSIFIYSLVIGSFLVLTIWSSRAVSTMAQKIPVERANTVVIDAGHGLPDGGASSCTGVLESQFNLDIALRLQDLMHLLGYRTKMLRTSEHSIYTEGETIAQKKISDLRQRVRITSETPGALLVSIHQNTFQDPKYSGAQVFYAKTPKSQELARDLQSAFCRHLNPGSTRKCKQASGVYLMDRIPCTGVLIECGFLSNPTESALLSTPRYQKKLCCVIGAGLAQFLTDGREVDIM